MKPTAEARSAAAPTPRVPLPSFDEIYDEHFPFVWRTARGLGVPEHGIDDATQEVFVVVHRRLGEFEGRSSIRTWLYGIARNTVRNHRRECHKHGVLERSDAAVEPDSLGDEVGLGPERAAQAAQGLRLVVALLDELDDEKREVFVLSELEQLTAREIAEMLNENINTVSSRLRLGREEFAAATRRYRLRDERRAK